MCNCKRGEGLYMKLTERLTERLILDWVGIIWRVVCEVVCELYKRIIGVLWVFYECFIGVL